MWMKPLSMTEITEDFIQIHKLALQPAVLSLVLSLESTSSARVSSFIPRVLQLDGRSHSDRTNYQQFQPILRSHRLMFPKEKEKLNSKSCFQGLRGKREQSCQPRSPHQHQPCITSVYTNSCCSFLLICSRKQPNVATQPHKHSTATTATILSPDFLLRLQL